MADEELSRESDSVDLENEAVVPGSEEETDPIQELQLDLEAAQQKAQESQDQMLRARAEVENIRRRAERDLQSAHKFALEKFAAALLPVADSLELGMGAVRDSSANLEKIQEGMELTLKLFSDTIVKFGITPILADGEKFNPDFHEAMTMVPTDDLPANSVMNVVQKGYLLNDRLLRPAKVIVSRPATVPQSKPLDEKA